MSGRISDKNFSSLNHRAERTGKEIAVDDSMKLRLVSNSFYQEPVGDELLDILVDQELDSVSEQLSQLACYHELSPHQKVQFLKGDEVEDCIHAAMFQLNEIKKRIL